MYSYQLSKRASEIQTQLLSIENELKELPEGKLLCVHNGSYSKWFRSDGGNKIYIPKKKRSFAEQLALRKYLLLLKDDLLRELRGIEHYLKSCAPDVQQAPKLLRDSSSFQELLSPHFQTISQAALDWQHAPYEKNPNHPEQLIHKTASGIYVRSKSESMIDYFLYTHKIPFRYECKLILGPYTYYPDFTILDPNTLQIFYWEHLGLMDDPSYVQKACHKIKTYCDYDIYPSSNLILTFETKETPLSIEQIEHIIQMHFLS